MIVAKIELIRGERTSFDLQITPQRMKYLKSINKISYKNQSSLLKYFTIYLLQSSFFKNS